MQISSDISPRRRRDNLFSTFRASEGSSEFVYIYLFYVRWSGFVVIFFFKGCFSFVALLFSSKLPSLTARVSLAHEVISSKASSNIILLEPNLVVANEVHDAVPDDHTELNLIWTS